MASNNENGKKSKDFTPNAMRVDLMDLISKVNTQLKKDGVSFEDVCSFVFTECSIDLNSPLFELRDARVSSIPALLSKLLKRGYIPFYYPTLLEILVNKFAEVCQKDLDDYKKKLEEYILSCVTVGPRGVRQLSLLIDRKWDELDPERMDENEIKQKLASIAECHPEEIKVINIGEGSLQQERESLNGKQEPYQYSRRAVNIPLHNNLPPAQGGGSQNGETIEQASDGVKEYPAMKSARRGLALIINNEHFVDHEQWSGIDRDEDNVVEIFRFLGYRVRVHRECTAKEIKGTFDNINALADDKDDSFICYILSHGIENVVYGSDSNEVYVKSIQEGDSLEERLYKCEKLSKKLKLLFVDTCHHSRVENRPIIKPKPCLVIDNSGEELSPRADFIIDCSSSWRDTCSGAFYVHTLCKTCDQGTCELKCCEALGDILTKVAEELGMTEIKVRRGAPWPCKLRGTPSLEGSGKTPENLM